MIIQFSSVFCLYARIILSSFSTSTDECGPVSVWLLLGVCAQDAAVLGHVRHPNLVAGVAFSLDTPAIVSELCHHGDLRSLIRRAESDPNDVMIRPWARR